MAARFILRASANPAMACPREAHVGSHSGRKSVPSSPDPHDVPAPRVRGCWDYPANSLTEAASSGGLLHLDAHCRPLTIVHPMRNHFVHSVPLDVPPRSSLGRCVDDVLPAINRCTSWKHADSIRALRARRRGSWPNSPVSIARSLGARRELVSRSSEASSRGADRWTRHAKTREAVGGWPGWG